MTDGHSALRELTDEELEDVAGGTTWTAHFSCGHTVSIPNTNMNAMEASDAGELTHALLFMGCNGTIQRVVASDD